MRLLTLLPALALLGCDSAVEIATKDYHRAAARADAGGKCDAAGRIAEALEARNDEIEALEWRSAEIIDCSRDNQYRESAAGREADRLLGIAGPV